MDNSNAQIVLRANEYLVTRRQIPRDLVTLESEFSRRGVSELLYGDDQWQHHESRKGFSTTDDTLIMLVKGFTHEEGRELGKFTIKNVVAWGLRNDYFAADEQEIYAFAKDHPKGYLTAHSKLHLQSGIIALGSSVLPRPSKTCTGKRICWASLQQGCEGPIFTTNSEPIDGVYAYNSQFLFVRRVHFTHTPRSL